MPSFSEDATKSRQPEALEVIAGGTPSAISLPPRWVATVDDFAALHDILFVLTTGIP